MDDKRTTELPTAEVQGESLLEKVEQAVEVAVEKVEEVVEGLVEKGKEAFDGDHQGNDVET